MTAENLNWKLPVSSGSDQVSKLAEYLGVGSLMAKVLDSRYQGYGEIETAISRGPELFSGPSFLKGCKEAADRILQCIQDGKNLLIYGDYDADGLTATAILYRTLNHLGADVRTYVPSRLEEGYGLHKAAIEFVLDRGADVLITVDCGIANEKEVDYAQSLGMNVIVTDHHQTPDRLPFCPILHPAHYPFRDISGAGVALLLSLQLGDGLSGSDYEAHLDAIFQMAIFQLAAIGTVADVMPLIRDNRYIVSRGLRAVQTNPLPGIEALSKVAKVDLSCMTSEDIAFYLGPIINAAGRMGQHGVALKLLLSDDPGECRGLAGHMAELNDRRKALCAEYLDGLTESYTVGRPLAVWGGYHYGLAGLLAGKLVEVCGQPVAVVSGSSGRGSARGVPGADLVEILGKCEGLEKFGGHKQAAGFTLQPGRLEAFLESFEVHAQVEREPASLQIDAIVSPADLTQDAVHELEILLSPFGEGNERPTVMIPGVNVGMRAVMGNQHFKCRIGDSFGSVESVAFFKSDWYTQIEDRVDIVGQPSINRWQGRESVQVKLLDWRESE